MVPFTYEGWYELNFSRSVNDLTSVRGAGALNSRREAGPETVCTLSWWSFTCLRAGLSGLFELLGFDYLMFWMRFVTCHWTTLDFRRMFVGSVWVNIKIFNDISLPYYHTCIHFCKNSIMIISRIFHVATYFRWWQYFDGLVITGF